MQTAADIIKQLNIQYIVCPACQGLSQESLGHTCPACAGMALVGYWNGRFFYWGQSLSRAIIKLSHLKNSLNLIINLTAYTIGIIGLASLAGWVFGLGNIPTSLGAFAFWRVKHWLILTFWLSLLADMFVIYRLSQEEALKHKIKKPKYQEKIDQIAQPNNWQELKSVKTKYKFDVARGFSYGANKVVEQAFSLADQAEHGQVKIMHLFFSLLRDDQAASLFARLNIDGPKLIGNIKNQLLLLPQLAAATELSSEVKEVLIEAYLIALNFGQKKVEAIHFILPCLKKDKILAEILYDLEIDEDKINNVINWLIVNQRLLENYRLYRASARFKPASNMDRAYTAVATPILNHFSRDLTIAAKWGRLELCVNQEKEIEKIFQALESGQVGVILIGPVGVGKNTIIGQIAQSMVEEDVPILLKDKRLLELDLPRLVSGATASQAEERLLVIIDELMRAGNIVLFVSNIENLMGITAGGQESLDLSEVLANALDRKQIICLATATSENYVKFIENKPLGNVMVKVEIREPEKNLAIQMLESKIGFLEAKYKVYFSYDSLARAVEFTSKYIHDKYLPAKAVEILESIAVKVVKIKGAGSLVLAEDVAVAVSDLTRIPITKITESESKNLLALEEKIHQRMIDQEEAVKMVAASLRRARAQLREAKRPIANFLFLGPTGVGKTELAKTVAEVYFGAEDYMIRLDMSEYQQAESIEKMIGSPAGELGYLTEAVRKSAFSLILLDEFEKAHPNILNLFLQVMDDGRLTDGQGRTIDFTNTIIIATSNAGAVFIQEQIRAGAPIDSIKQQLINEHLIKVLRPELINRFDGVIVFKPLSLKEVNSIAKIMLGKVKKLLADKGIGMKIDEQGVEKLAQAGFDPKFGARPLRRLIQEKIEDEIANKILAGELKRRDIVVIDEQAQVQVEKGREL